MTEPKRVLMWAEALPNGGITYSNANVSGGLTRDERAAAQRKQENLSAWDITALQTSALRLSDDIAILKAKLEEAESSKPILIPESIDYHNASTARCDVLNAPCACGSQHSVEDMLERLWLLVRFVQPEADRLGNAKEPTWLKCATCGGIALEKGDGGLCHAKRGVLMSGEYAGLVHRFDVADRTPNEGRCKRELPTSPNPATP